MSVVLITGCSSGIGLETALAFGRVNHTVFASMRDTRKAETLLTRAAQEGVSLAVLQLDVTDTDSVNAAVERVEAEHSAVDILVNNAGLQRVGSIETTEWDDARALMETNVWGPVRTIRAVLPGMRRQRSGVIINVSSAVALIPGLCHAGFYVASKKALGALTESLAMEVGAFGIRVSCVELGPFATQIYADAHLDPDPTSPYAADHRWAASLATATIGDDPARAAESIIGVATDDRAPTHVLVGEGKLVKLATISKTFEDWLPVITKPGSTDESTLLKVAHPRNGAPDLGE